MTTLKSKSLGIGANGKEQIEVELADGQIIIVESDDVSMAQNVSAWEGLKLDLQDFIKQSPAMAVTAGIVLVIMAAVFGWYFIRGAVAKKEEVTPTIIVAPTEQPTALPRKTYGMFLDRGFNAYSAPEGGDFLGYVEPGRGYAPIANNGEWLYADVQDAGEVWLKDIPAAVAPTTVLVPQPVVVVAPAPTAFVPNNAPIVPTERMTNLQQDVMIKHSGEQTKQQPVSPHTIR